MDEAALNDSLSRYVVGIDLGTTNSSCAYVDTNEASWTVRDFPILQLTAASTVEPRDVLPSFHYEPAGGEFGGSALNLPWSNGQERHVVGVLAREHGATVPGRQVASAKSWLSHRGVDRTAPLLPWHGAPDVEKLSPVDVSARYLAHLRAAWDHAHGEHPLAAQDVVLTVPASFDEVARELTVEAARRAGLVRLTLVEEPQAAFYAWIAAQGDRWQAQVRAGQKILVADVGGGTTDFTLIQVKPAGNAGVLFHRVAVGEHLLLGGDNLDLALAHHVEQKLGQGKLFPAQWGMLLRSARAVKEQMLSEEAPQHLTVNVTGGGSKLIGGARQVELTRQEVRELLVEGFLPRVQLDARPASRRSGFQEFGLPFAPDAAITRYLAQFLMAHRETAEGSARPDVVLFNGGFFASPLLRTRLLEVLRSWFESDTDGEKVWQPLVLRNDRLDLAVSRGAAYYAMVRRGKGVRIAGGLAHSYYVGVDVASAAQEPVAVPQPLAVCLLPAGVEEGHEVRLPRRLDLLIRQPVEFPLYYSATRTTDAPGTLVAADPEQLTSLPPIRTVLQSGRKVAADTVGVELHARLTEIGTLELWAQEMAGERRWKLQFDVRSAARAEAAAHIGVGELEGFVDQNVLLPAEQLIRQTFGPKVTLAAPAPHLPAPPTPQALVKRLELVSGLSRHDWPSSLLRSFWQVLMEMQDGRKLSAEHEIRWLNLTGFCLRPGYGLAADDWRVSQVWRLFSQKVHHAKNEQVRGEWWVVWRRVAGGLSPGQQLTIAEPLLAALRSRLRPTGPVVQPKNAPFQYGPHETAEVYRLLGSLELLRCMMKEELGNLLLQLLRREKAASSQSAALFAIGRIGSRVPAYGPLNLLVEAEVVERWIPVLLEWPPQSAVRPQLLFSLVQLSRLTQDRYRDVSAAARNAIIDYLLSQQAPEHYLRLLREGGQLEADEQRLAFGESLPKGLRID